MTLKGINGTTYQIDPNPIGSGGEGDICRVLGMGYVAKIYKSETLSAELENKLRVMIEHPPNASVLSQVAWPLDVVFNDNDKPVGFIMPELSINAELGDIYTYPPKLPLSAHQKVNIAQNICVVISEVHKAGYIFGDFNPRNIGLDKNTGLVSFLDTDTYHVSDETEGKTYRCNVCAPGYAAPELLEKCSDYVAANPTASKDAYAQTPLPTFNKETDNFALAIHVFKLLMNGYTPFGGIIETAAVSQSSPGVGDAAVRRDSYCFKPGYKHQSAAILPLEAFPQEIADLFTRAFIIGKHDPKQRPSAEEWYEALSRYEQAMVTCPKDSLHQYYSHNASCPLCEADERYQKIVGGNSHTAAMKQAVYSTSPPILVSPQNMPPVPASITNINTQSPTSKVALPTSLIVQGSMKKSANASAQSNASVQIIGSASIPNKDRLIATAVFSMLLIPVVWMAFALSRLFLGIIIGSIGLSELIFWILILWVPAGVCVWPFMGGIISIYRSGVPIKFIAGRLCVTSVFAGLLSHSAAFVGHAFYISATHPYEIYLVLLGISCVVFLAVTFFTKAVVKAYNSNSEKPTKIILWTVFIIVFISFFLWPMLGNIYPFLLFILVATFLPSLIALAVLAIKRRRSSNKWLV